MAPPVVVVVVSTIAAVGVAVAFHQFVYEPHIAPRVERWAENFLEKRRAKRRSREGVPVATASGSGSGAGHGHGQDGSGLGFGAEGMSETGRSTYELENLVKNEVAQWRSQVSVSQGLGEGTATLRQRHAAGRVSTPLDESNTMIPYDPLTPTAAGPTHVLFDDSMSVSAISPTSSMSSRVGTPLSSSRSTLSHQSFRAPPPMPQAQAPPTPDPSVRALSPLQRAPSAAGSAANPFSSPADRDLRAPSVSSSAFASPMLVPSLSLSHPVDLAADAERDLELLSAPSSSTSSRPSSPSAFSDSAFSHSDEQVFHSFTMSPSMTMGGGSGSAGLGSPFVQARSEISAHEHDHDDELERWSNAGSEILSESSWASAGARSH
ncbi:hypothetical protein HMN09_00369200 [Mycena chlorophos]|uniref:Uncharacterized protein n=1 Tax=Mycena chlorophos TaxID=658473 RepID=A0A8H6WI77_MYCCL|nr:hypothetical protein HMN09_00369200 [Mycena chlorophos]